MDKFIVITSIFQPTEAIEKFAKLKGWKVIVVGDKKTATDWSYPGVTYLSPEGQNEVASKFSGLLPWNSYTRKNIGYLHAISQGARVIYESDDDNIPLDNWVNEPEFSTDGSQFDHLLKEGEHFSIGALSANTMYVPGHTPACVAYQIADAVFVGDTMFMPDVGTARCDFPGGDAKTLYASAKKILSLPDETRLFMCHDYPPTDRPVAFETTVGEQRRKNIHVHDGISEAAFVDMRTKRDATLEMPVLILPAVQINIRAGDLPPAESNGVAYVKIPLNAL
jgi:glyoxylase-like metal-dependent hydrolase (beta-lactamase superfamily II)